MSTLSGTNGHLDRKELKRPDEFMRTVSGLGDKAAKNPRALIIGLVVLAVLGAALAFLASKRNEKAEEASTALYQARQAMDTELKAVASASKPDAKTPAKAEPDADSVAYAKLDVDTKMPETVKKLTGVADKYGNTRAGFEAKLGLGNLYFDHGQADKAAPWFQKALDSAPANLEKGFAAAALGYAHEASGKYNEAVQAFEKSLNLGAEGVKGDVLLALGRSYEALKDTAKARSTYDRILSELPNTPQAKTAEQAKGQLPK